MKVDTSKFTTAASQPIENQTQWSWTGSDFAPVPAIRRLQPDIRESERHPTALDLGFGQWYARHIGRQHWLVQVVLWAAYGFLWIPAYYWLWRWEKRGRITPTSAWAVRIAIPIAALLIWKEHRRTSRLREQADYLAEAIERRRRRSR